MRTRSSIVVGAVLLFALGCSPSPVPSASPPPTGVTPAPAPIAPSATPGAIPSAGVSAIYRTWTRSDLPIAVPGIFGGNTPRDVVAFGGRMLAVGGVNGGCCDGSFSTDTRALVWFSTDGATWDLVRDAPAFELGSMNAAAARPGHVVAVGSLQLRSAEFEGQVDPRGAVWASSDGSEWRLVTDVPHFDDLVATADGFVASTLAGANPEIWGSDDGRSWTRLAGRAELGDGSIDRLLVLESGGVVAVGRSEAFGVEPPSLEPADAVVWRSPDGRSWARVADQAAFTDGWMRDVAERSGRLVAIGSGDLESGTSVWTSDDGLAWTRHSATALGADDTFVDRAMAGPTGFIVVGSTGDADTSVIAWTSLDGEVWARVPGQPALDGGAAAPDVAGWIAAGDGSIVAVGSRWDMEAGEQAPVAWRIR